MLPYPPPGRRDILQPTSSRARVSHSDLTLTRRSLLQRAALAAAVWGLPLPRCARAGDPDRARLTAWLEALRRGSPTASFGEQVVRVGELAAGSPYEAGMLEHYLAGGAAPAEREPLTLSLTRFDCVTLVESCLAVARVAVGGGASEWDDFAAAVEAMRYREGVRAGYASRLHYFSEWIADGARRRLVRDLGSELGGVEDRRPLHFMSEHRASYPALADAATFEQIGAMEQRLDPTPRLVIPTARLPEVSASIENGDVLAFATSIPGLDVTHAALAHRDASGTLRVLHAPLSGGVVEVSRLPLPDYVAAIRRATGILVARPAAG